MHGYSTDTDEKKVERLALATRKVLLTKLVGWLLRRTSLAEVNHS